jgi:hypothetical protein
VGFDGGCEGGVGEGFGGVAGCEGDLGGAQGVGGEGGCGGHCAGGAEDDYVRGGHFDGLVVVLVMVFGGVSGGTDVEWLFRWVLKVQRRVDCLVLLV